ncbi:hypothetical protein [Cysteiniphilum litorale]|uniref:hypothetical protein n=1 Tax=Cysteiniphilum litorale TaxID=2056700 RepID=UPI003F883A5C
MKTKCIIIKDSTHKALRQYCLDHSKTILEAATEIISVHLHNNGYEINEVNEYVSSNKRNTKLI